MDFKTLFGDGSLTFEQFSDKIKSMKLVDLNEGGFVSKEKFDKTNNELKDAQTAIKTLEENKDNADELAKELKRYKDAEEARQEAEKAAERTAGIKQRFAPLRGENTFLNEGTENWIFSEFEKALDNKDYQGKSDAEIYAAITKDKNIYVNPQEPFKNPPMGLKPKAKTDEDYLKAKYGRNPWANF